MYHKKELGFVVDDCRGSRSSVARFSVDFTFTVLFLRVPMEDVPAIGRKPSRVSGASNCMECEAIARYPSVRSWWYAVRSSCRSTRKLGFPKVWDVYIVPIRSFWRFHFSALLMPSGAYPEPENCMILFNTEFFNYIS
jgi:hypothetical protein